MSDEETEHGNPPEPARAALVQLGNETAEVAGKFAEKALSKGLGDAVTEVVGFGARAAVALAKAALGPTPDERVELAGQRADREAALSVPALRDQQIIATRERKQIRDALARHFDHHHTSTTTVMEDELMRLIENGVLTSEEVEHAPNLQRAIVASYRKALESLCVHAGSLVRSL